MIFNTNNKIQKAVQDLAQAAYYKLGQIFEQIEDTCDIKLLVPILQFINNYECEREIAVNKYPYAGDVCIDGDDPCKICGEIDCICELYDDDDEIVVI